MRPITARATSETTGTASVGMDEPDICPDLPEPPRPQFPVARASEGDPRPVRAPLWIGVVRELDGARQPPHRAADPVRHEDAARDDPVVLVEAPPRERPPFSRLEPRRPTHAHARSKSLARARRIVVRYPPPPRTHECRRVLLVACLMCACTRSSRTL